MENILTTLKSILLNSFNISILNTYVNIDSLAIVLVDDKYKIIIDGDNVLKNHEVKLGQYNIVSVGDYINSEVVLRLHMTKIQSLVIILEQMKTVGFTESEWDILTKLMKGV